MKQKSLTKKLTLNKKTIAALDEAVMNEVRGGTTMRTICYGYTCYLFCEFSNDIQTCTCVYYCPE